MTNLAPGMLLLPFLNAIILTLPASVVLLIWYRFSVARGMRLSATDLTGNWTGQIHVKANTGKQVHTGGIITPDLPADSSTRRRLAIIYCFSGMMAALIPMAIIFFVPGMEFTAMRGFCVWYSHLWPIIPIVSVLLSYPFRRSFLAFIFYVLAGCIIVFCWSSIRRFGVGNNDVSPISNTLSLIQYLGMQAWLPGLLILITGNRRLRSISPLVLSALLVFSYSALGVNQLLIRAMDIDFLQRILLGVGGAAAGHWLFMLASLPVGFFCWLGLQWLTVQYNRKQFSDVQLLVDSWWLIVVFFLTAMSAADWGWAALWNFSAFVVYRTGVFVGTRLWAVEKAANQTHRLLLLRVFGHQRRTERLFDLIAQRWRFIGPINMIAGADLALRTIDPGDFINFLGGRLTRQFVASQSDLEEKLQVLDNQWDPDGRYRVNEFFCYDNIWRISLSALLTQSDMVLMDLRGFSESNKGCQFELEQLAESGMLQRTLLLLDESTDPRELQRALPPTLVNPGSKPRFFNFVSGDERDSAVVSEILDVLRGLQTQINVSIPVQT